MKSVLMDVGGTWTRIRVDNRVDKFPTPSVLHQPDTPHDLLVHELIQLLANHAPQDGAAYVALGAAYDDEADIAYGSAPLWGPGRWVVPFQNLLEAARPDVHWNVVNDVTAGLADFMHRFAQPTDRYVTYLTISSGIALRTAYSPTRCIDVNDEGLQGEIGHLLAMSCAPEAVRSLKCDCGKVGHIAAISSGPAIPRVTRALGFHEAALQLSENTIHSCYSEERRLLLRTIVEPIAQLIRCVCALQPHIDLIGIGGGVPTGIGKPYREELMRQLQDEQSYADNVLASSIRFLVGDFEVMPEIGAELVATGQLRVNK